jgi:ribosomal protein S20
MSNSAYAGVPSALQQQRSDFKQLTQALQSGDLSSAQQAYSALAQASSNSIFSPNNSSPLAEDFQAVGKALQSGDIQGAQTALTQFQKDASAALSSQSQPASGAPRAHHGHHHHADADNDGDSSGTASATSGNNVNLLA